MFIKFNVENIIGQYNDEGPNVYIRYAMLKIL